MAATVARGHEVLATEEQGLAAVGKDNEPQYQLDDLDHPYHMVAPGHCMPRAPATIGQARRRPGREELEENLDAREHGQEHRGHCRGASQASATASISAPVEASALTNERVVSAQGWRREDRVVEEAEELRH